MRADPGAALLSLFLFLLLFQLFGRYLFDYALDADGLSFRLFRRLRVMRIRYEDIAEIGLSQGIGFAFTLWSLHLNNRLFGGGILLRKRHGLYRNVTFTPDDPERFAAELRQRCG